MEIRQAILKAAAYIENKPSAYNFQLTKVPNCGSQGCLIGWIACFLGIPEGKCIWGENETFAVIGVSASIFGDRMTDIRREHSSWEAYTRSAKSAAACLRVYADKYHPEKPSNLSSGADICREIISKTYREGVEA